MVLHQHLLKFRKFRKINEPLIADGGEMALSHYLEIAGEPDGSILFAYRKTGNLYLQRLLYLPYDTDWVTRYNYYFGKSYSGILVKL